MREMEASIAKADALLCAMEMGCSRLPEAIQPRRWDEKGAEGAEQERKGEVGAGEEACVDAASAVPSDPCMLDRSPR
jgi:hypothetical protein